MSSKIYIPTDEEVESLQRQIIITDDDARDLLLKHEGDLVECVLDSYGHKEKKKPETKANTNEQEVFTDLRKIVNEKNKMYSEHIEQKGNTSVEIESKKDFKQSYYQQKQINNSEIKVI